MRIGNAIRRSVAVGVAVAALGAGALATAGTASAAGKDGSLTPGELGLYFLQNQSSYVFDLYVSDADFSNDTFPGTSISANDNAESYWNRDTLTWDVYTDANRGGVHGWIDAGVSSNASTNFKNKVSSAYYR
ncbi:peptidase inhibitor family I36 protein [Kitasatospora sp. NPDC048365]|uniref:peptidase inhibitor family I36 protein n=1 Tax=Kitasatospora sp. NPDC048365 TaxID=3364050 RepID=UPI0037146640